MGGVGSFKSSGRNLSSASSPHALSGTVPEKILRTHSKQFHHMDAFWELDDLIMKQLLGDNGIHKMKQRWAERVIPKSVESADLSASLAASKAVVEFQGTLFATAAVKAEINCAHSMLERIQSGEAVLPCRDVTEWCASMARQLEIFVSAMGDKKSGSASLPRVLQSLCLQQWSLDMLRGH